MKQNNSTSTQSKTLAILQLARLGDLLQTAKAVENFKKYYPNIKLVLLARKSFAEGLDFILNKTFDKVITLDLSSHYLTGFSQLSSLCHDLKNTIQKINALEISVLVNLTYTQTASLLSTLIKASQKMGPRRDQHGQLHISDEWSQYTFANILGGELNPFNLVDLYKNLIGLSGIPYQENASEEPKHPPLSQKVTEEEINDTGLHSPSTLGPPTTQRPFDSSTDITPSTPIILLHPFASQKQKSWDKEIWIQFLNLLKNYPFSIKIIGSTDPATQEYFEHQVSLLNVHSTTHPCGVIYNFIGKTTLQELFHLIEKAQLLIGHDSMSIHLAALAKVQTITISLGNTRPFETFPYGTDHYILTPKRNNDHSVSPESDENFNLHKRINPEVLCALTEALCRQDSELLKPFEENFSSSKFKIYRTFSLGTSLSLQNLETKETDLQDTFRQFYLIIWSFYFLNREINLSIPHLGSTTRPLLQSYAEAIDKLVHLFELSEKYARFIWQNLNQKMNTPHTTLSEYSKKLLEIDTLQEKLIQNYPLLSPMVNYSKTYMSFIASTDLEDLSLKSIHFYQSLKLLLMTLQELLTLTLKNHHLDLEAR